MCKSYSDNSANKLFGSGARQGHVESADLELWRPLHLALYDLHLCLQLSVQISQRTEVVVKVYTDKTDTRDVPNMCTNVLDTYQKIIEKM